MRSQKAKKKFCRSELFRLQFFMSFRFQIYRLQYKESTLMDKKKMLDPLFVDIKGDSQPTIIESVCVNCFQNGETIILMTKIPFFRELIITSFRCQQCGFKNNQVQFAGELPDYGVDILFRVMGPEDLNRQIIKSDFARISLQELQLQIPPSKKAQITTIEGLLTRVADQLSSDQEERKDKNPEQYEQIASFIQKLNIYKNGQKFPLTVRVMDPSGNSNIKNPFAPKQDKNLQITNVPRTLDELQQMGYSVQNAKQQIRQAQQKKAGNKLNFTKPFQESQFMKYEPVIFEVPCHACQMVGQMKMCQTSVPYFTDLVIMSFVCDYCGSHNTQTKTTGEVSDKALTITLKANSDEDLKRDLFKSQTCAVILPELELQLDYGTLGGVFTTVQGLLEKIEDHLGQRNPFADSDSQFHARMSALLSQLKELRQGGKDFTLILKDPLAHSFLQNPNHPDQDPRATRVFQDRTEEQNENLGLNDIKVENYQVRSPKSDSMKKKERKVSQGSVEEFPKKQ